MKFGDNLQNLRKLKKMSQEKLAEKVDVSRQSISKWERGESYPTMNNIITLCEIFHCNINELVQESLVDINSLDEEIKMNVVKFKVEKQKKMKGISKTIYVIARIGEIILIASAVILAVLMFALLIFANGVKIEDNSVRFFEETYNYETNDRIITVTEESTGKSTELYVDTDSDLQEFFNNHSKTFFVISTEFIGICIIVFFTLIFFMLKNIEKLFINIHNEDTPFTLENINYIRKIAMFLIIAIIAPTIFGIIFQAIIKMDMNIGIELMDLILVLIIFSMAYIFEYGYELQLDSRGKMYGDENE
ncbi:MAG: helix-turn-helix domain-containing protein [Clostridia bacterium]|nr:helix-turn-helix domain-containing protein [Clostridia bacterium]